MGNCLEMPKMEENHTTHTTPLQESDINFNRNSPVILPFNNFTVRPDGIEDTERKQPIREEVANLEVETVKLDTSFISGNTSQYSVGSRATGHGRYIKRYRNEEEKLLDMLQERERLLNSAIRQGQQLRAKCTRYQDELENVRETTRLDLTEQQWKKRYYEMDKKYRDIKEEVDVMVARNRNGRDFLRTQQDEIDSLNLELQKEKIERQRILSSSLTSLQSAGGVDKRRGKLLLMQLQIDNSLLQDRVQELTQRNARGRDYLSRLEAEKRDQHKQIMQLKEELSREKEEKESLLSRLAVSQKSPRDGTYTEGVRHSYLGGQELYAQVQRNRPQQQDGRRDDAHAKIDSISTGFELDDDTIRPIEPERQYNVLSGVYDEVEILPLEFNQDTAGKAAPRQRLSESESLEEKSVNELNAEAIIDQINVETDPTPRDISTFNPKDKSYNYTYGEENGIPNELLNNEESLTKF